MGLIYSVTEMMSGVVNDVETTQETRPDGTVFVMKRRNPWLSGITILSLSTFLILYCDSTSHTLKAIFNRQPKITN